MISLDYPFSSLDSYGARILVFLRGCPRTKPPFRLRCGSNKYTAPKLYSDLDPAVAAVSRLSVVQLLATEDLQLMERDSGWWELEASQRHLSAPQ